MFGLFGWCRCLFYRIYSNIFRRWTVNPCICSMRPNIFLGVAEGSAQYKKWYFELVIDQVDHFVTGESTHLRVGWANTRGYAPYPGGGEGWGGNGVGDDLYSYSFDGLHLWSGRIIKIYIFLKLVIYCTSLVCGSIHTRTALALSFKAPLCGDPKTFISPHPPILLSAWKSHRTSSHPVHGVPFKALFTSLPRSVSSSVIPT